METKERLQKEIIEAVANVIGRFEDLPDVELDLAIKWGKKNEDAPIDDEEPDEEELNYKTLSNEDKVRASVLLANGELRDTMAKFWSEVKAVVGAGNDWMNVLNCVFKDVSKMNKDNFTIRVIKYC